MKPNAHIRGNTTPCLPLVLASTSPFRQQLLQRLDITFSIESPDVDEQALAQEPPQALVQRLSEAKAREAGRHHPTALVIGSDQVACVEGRILGKPGNRNNAIAQLERASGKRVSFYTGLCLLNTVTNKAQIECVPFHVHFRTLTRQEIEHYVDKEQPLNCAGSFKSEGLGIALFERLEGDDPTALIGLPLIRLVAMLAVEGVNVL